MFLPSMKLDKAIVQRRLDLMAAEGVVSGIQFLSN
jgi:NADPH-dependent glutamate synthase beta subunit-like oxidoreductase